MAAAATELPGPGSQRASGCPERAQQAALHVDEAQRLAGASSWNSWKGGKFHQSGGSEWKAGAAAALLARFALAMQTPVPARTSPLALGVPGHRSVIQPQADAAPCAMCELALPAGARGERCMFCGVMYCTSHCRMAHWAMGHNVACSGSKDAQRESCGTWVAAVHSFLQSKNGAPVPLSELGLRIKKPAHIGKKYKLLDVLQADSRFKWYKAAQKTNGHGSCSSAYLSVAVEGASGMLQDGSIPVEVALGLIAGTGAVGAAGGTRGGGGDTALDVRTLEPCRVPAHLAESIIFVGSMQTVAQAAQAIDSVLSRAGSVPWTARTFGEQKEFVVGLDSEWRPSFKKGVSFRTSILQVAFPALLLIFDLHWIHSTSSPLPAAVSPGTVHAARTLGSAAAAATAPSRLAGQCERAVLGAGFGASREDGAKQQALRLLRRVLQTDRLLKIGFAFRGDLDKLFSDFGTIAVVEPFIDLQDMRREQTLGVAAGDEGAGAGPGAGGEKVKTKLSLQSVVADRLGRKLLKTQRMSNWESRPLSTAQLQYAVLDALVLVQMFEGLSQPELARVVERVQCLKPGSCEPAQLEWLAALVRHLETLQSAAGTRQGPARVAIADLRAGVNGCPAPLAMRRPVHKVLADSSAMWFGLEVDADFAFVSLTPHTAQAHHVAVVAEHTVRDLGRGRGGGDGGRGRGDVRQDVGDSRGSKGGRGWRGWRGSDRGRGWRDKTGADDEAGSSRGGAKNSQGFRPGTGTNPPNIRGARRGRQGLYQA